MGKRTKIIFIVLGALVLVGIVGLVLSLQTADSYARMSISASRTSVNINLELEDGPWGPRPLGGGAFPTTDVTVAVNNAPSGIGSGVFVQSLDSSIATASVVGRSGNNNVIRITPVNGGSTIIRVLTTGGGRTLDIRVNVDIPAKNVETAEGTHFGVMKEQFEDAVLQFHPRDFNFFATPAVRDFNFTTTINALDYEIIGWGGGAPVGGDDVRIEGDRFIVTPNALRGNYLVRARLRHSPNIYEDFTVYVFDNFGHVNIHDPTTGGILNLGGVVPLADLVNNDTRVGPDWIDYRVSLDPGRMPLTGNNYVLGDYTANFGYRLVSGNLNLAHVHWETDGLFRISANGIGDTMVDVIVYPIVNRSDGTRLRFNRVQDSHLQRRAQIVVEVRNVFRQEAGLHFTQENERVNMMHAFFLPQPPLARNFFGLDLEQNLIVNNTPTHPANNHVRFEVEGLPNVPAIPAHFHTEPWQFLQITHSRNFINPNHFNLMTPADFINGVPFDSVFSVTIRHDIAAATANALIEATTLRLVVRSVEQFPNGTTPLITHSIPLQGVRAVTDLWTENREEDKIQHLFPVLGDTRGAYVFYVASDLGSNTLNQFISFIPSANSQITRSNGQVIPLFLVNFLARETGPATPPEGWVDRGRLRYEITVNPALTQEERNNILIGIPYAITVRYINGASTQVFVEVQERLTGLDIFLRDHSASHIFSQVQNIDDAPRVTFPGHARVQIDGTYLMQMMTRPARASVWATIQGNGVEADMATFTFTPRTVGTHQVDIMLHALNPEVLTGLGMGPTPSFRLTLVVINPIISADFDMNFVRIYSRGSLSHMPDIQNNIDDSFEHFNLRLTYARTLEGTDPSLRVNAIVPATSQGFIELSQRGDLTQWTVQGLQATGGIQTLFFDIYQVMADGFRVEFTVNHPLRFFVEVRDAVTIRSITALDVGESINIVLPDGNPRETSVRTQIYPVRVHNPVLGFGFEVGGRVFDDSNRLFTVITNDNNQIIASIDPITGVIRAERSNLGDYEHDIVLIIFATDSVRMHNGQLLRPLVYTRLSVFIFDETAGDGQFMISTLEDFLRHFRFNLNEVPEHQTFGGRTFRIFRYRGPTNEPLTGYYRLAGDIDFSGVMIEPITWFGGQFVGTKVYAMTGGHQVTNYELRNMTIIEVGTISNRRLVSRSHGAENYGLFARLGQRTGNEAINERRGLVEGVQFTNFNFNLNYERDFTNGQATVNFGVVAAINEGTIRDVVVEITYGVYNARWFDRLSIGGIAGRNRGQIVEGRIIDGRVVPRGSLHVSGIVQVVHGGENNPTAPGGLQVFHVNAGGIVGTNEQHGVVRGRNAGGILGDNIIINSELTLIYTATSMHVRDDVDKNVGGIAGRNDGRIEEVSSQNVLVNMTRGAVGGVIGLNNTTGVLANVYSTSAIYARGTIGGIVGRNRGEIRNAYFDFYVNETLKETLNSVLFTYLPASVRDGLDWRENPFYAAFIVGRGSNNLGGASPATTVGGVVGVNSGNIHNSFASSIFTSKTQTVLGLDYRGDIYVFGAFGNMNVIVGGVIGRQENPAGNRSVVEGVYSRLTIRYQSIRGLPGPQAAAAPLIGGIIGQLEQNANVFVLGSYSFNNYVIDSVADETMWVGTLPGQRLPLTIAGIVGRNLSTNSNVFALTYSIFGEDQVEWLGTAFSARLFTQVGIHVGTAINWTNSFRQGSANMRGLDLRNPHVWFATIDHDEPGFNSRRFNAGDYFINFSNVNIDGMPRLGAGVVAGSAAFFQAETAFIHNMEFPYPFIRSNFDPNLRTQWQAPFDIPYEIPLFIAKPTRIELVLRTYEEYRERTPGRHEVFGEHRNNRGGFNYVIPAAENLAWNNPSVLDHTHVNSAALFFSSGAFQPSAMIANRYYLDDLFETRVSPAIASRRLRVFLMDNPGVARLGLDMTRGEPLWYVQLLRLGSFEIHAESTRHYGEEDRVIGMVRFDVVQGVTNQMVSRDVMGTVGYRTLWSGTQANNPFWPEDPANVIIPFAVQKGTTFFMDAHVDQPSPMAGWDIRGRFYVSGIPHDYAVGSPIYFFDTSSVDFVFIPFIRTVNRQGTAHLTYNSTHLSITIPVTIHDGALHLDIHQESTTIDGVSSSVYSGVIITDVWSRATIPHTTRTLNELNSSRYATPAAQAQAARWRIEQLLALTEFSFESDYIERTHRLFGEGSDAFDRTIVPIIDHVSGRNFNLVFTINVEPNIRPHYVTAIEHFGYREYRFNITMSVEINSSAYDDVGNPIYTTPSAMPSGIIGDLHVTERLHSNAQGLWTNWFEPLSASATVEIIAQELHSAHFQHFTSTRSVGVDMLELTPSNQLQSMNIYTEGDESGGLLKIYTSPMFANIESLVITSSTHEQVIGTVGERDNAVDLIKEWEIGVNQLVYLGNGIYENYGGADGGEVHVFHQVSNRIRAGGARPVDSWDGVYYFHTFIRAVGEHADTPHPIHPGARFEITATFISEGQEHIHTFELFAIDRPGLYFNYDHPRTERSLQAIGTAFEFTMDYSGVIAEGWQNNFDVYYDSNLITESPFVRRLDDRWNPERDRFDYVFELVIPSHNGLNHFPIGELITVVFRYQIEQHGDLVPATSQLLITTTLFRVTGFRMAGVQGSTVRLINNNQQSMELRANVLQYRGNDEVLLSRIRNAVMAFENEINSDAEELLTWTGRNDMNSFRLNPPPPNNIGSGGYYNNPVGPNAADDMRGQLNFFLGMDGDSGIKFITSASLDRRTTWLTIDMRYEFTTGNYVVIRGGDRMVTTTFAVITVRQSSEDNPTPIFTEQQLRDMSTNGEGHYILMSDLTLNGWVPLGLNVATFDGNNRRIFLNSFNLTPPPTTGGPATNNTQNIGLFSTIAPRTLLKNLNIVLSHGAVNTLAVDLSNFDRANVTVNIGALAGTSQGIVTNVAVLSGGEAGMHGSMEIEGQFNRGRGGNWIADYDRSTFDTRPHVNAARSRLGVYVDNTTMTVNLGGLVGLNHHIATGTNSGTGVISNSRVLVDVHLGPIERGDTSRNLLHARVGGFAGVNNGYIVSSFFRDANITNDAMPRLGTPIGTSRTGGFVATNGVNGVIRGSYVMGATTQTTTQGHAAHVTHGAIRSAYGVAGFIYENGGIIQDSYTNIILTPFGSFRDGFVSFNAMLNAQGLPNVNQGGIIRTSFADNPQQTVTAQHPTPPAVFVNAERAHLGTFENNRFRHHGAGAPPTDGVGGQRFLAVTVTNFNQLASFDGWSLSPLDEIDPPNIWAMTQNGPRLIGANHIAVSVRFVDRVNNQDIIRYAAGFEYGTSRYNPIVIATGDQFNRHIYRGSYYYQGTGLVPEGTDIDWERNIYQGYLRLVNNISVATGQELEYYQGVLHTYRTIFRGHFDGNGLWINDISLNAAPAVGLRSVGLFSKLEYATVKNINLGFTRHMVGEQNFSIGAPNATFVGGLAGVAINSNIVDVNAVNRFTGNPTLAQIMGANIVGGVIGAVINFEHAGTMGSGTYRIENVFSDVPVRSQIRNLEIAPVDVSFSGGDSYVFDLPYARQGIAGGVIGIITTDPRLGRAGAQNDAGMLLRDINGEAVANVNRLATTHYNIRNIGNYEGNPIIVNSEVVGGIVGVIEPRINATRINYIQNKTSAVVAANNHLRGKFYIGGLVGINMGRLTNSEIRFSNGPDAVEFFSLNVQSAHGHSYIFDSTGGGVYGMVVGGVAGANTGEIINVHSRVNMATDEAAGTNPVQFSQIKVVGGLVGENLGGDIMNSTVHGPVAGGFMLGGLVGFNVGGGRLTGNTVALNTVGTTAEGNGILASQAHPTGGLSERQIVTSFTLGGPGGVRWQFFQIDDRGGPEKFRYTGSLVGFYMGPRPDVTATTAPSSFGAHTIYRFGGRQS